MRLCINCHTENPDDVVFCSKCGMSLMGAPPTGEEARKLAEERQRRLNQPLTPSGIVYLFGDQFARQGGSEAARMAANVWKFGSGRPRLKERAVRAPYSGQQVDHLDLSRKLLEAAFVSLAQGGYLSLEAEKTRTLFLSGEEVTISQKKSGDDLPPSLERSITEALARAPQERPLRTLVSGLAKRDALYIWHYECAVAVDIVADALTEMGWLQRGAPTEEAAPLLAAMAGQAEIVKARLENFAALNPHLHTRLVGELRRRPLV
jgi:hypothetical protein